MFCFLRFDNGRKKNTARIRIISFWYRFLKIEDFFRNIYVWEIQFQIQSFQRNKITHVFSCRWDAYCFPHTYFFSNFRCKMLVVGHQSNWCSCAQGIHGYMDMFNHTLSIYAWSGSPQSFARRIASYKIKKLSHSLRVECL